MNAKAMGKDAPAPRLMLRARSADTVQLHSEAPWRNG